MTRTHERRPSAILDDPAGPTTSLIDFDPIERHLADLLDRHDQAHRTTSWNYAELTEALQLRRLETITRTLGDGPVDLQQLRAAWASGHGPIAPAHAYALETAYLGEINLPWYAENLTRHLRSGHTLLADFFRRWVAEEDQHGRAFEIYLLLDRVIPGSDTLASKTDVLLRGRDAPSNDPFRIMIYTSIQELSTRVFYARLAHEVGDSDPLLVELLRRVQADESLHLAFYRDAVRLALDHNPHLKSVVHEEINNFREPVTVLPDYEQRKATIWREGISNINVFRTNVVEPLLRYWHIPESEETLRRWGVQAHR